jgi:glyceraldehyde 3-phosphate dehydrogenase
MNGKLTGMALRIPSADVSVVDLTVELNSETTYEAICAAMQLAANSELKRVLAYTDEKVVSTDFRGESAAGVFDADAGIMLDSSFVKIVGWYDNEYGYTCNLLRLTQFIAHYHTPIKSVTKQQDADLLEAV